MFPTGIMERLLSVRQKQTGALHCSFSLFPTEYSALAGISRQAVCHPRMNLVNPALAVLSIQHAQGMVLTLEVQKYLRKYPEDVWW